MAMKSSYTTRWDTIEPTAEILLQKGAQVPKKRRKRDRAPTRNEQLVLKVLEENERPLGAYEILSELKGEGIRAPLQVYRALRRLQMEGRVHRLESLNAFVLCSLSCAHTHRPSDTVFVICDRCGAVEELRNDAVFEALYKKVRERDFRIAVPMIEVHGRCSACV